jgi:adenylate cyclase
MLQKDRKNRVLFPIGAKLAVITSVLLLASLGAVTVMVSVLSTQDVQLKAEDNNYTVNWRAGSQAEGYFKSIQAAVLLYLEITDRVSQGLGRDAEIKRYFFNHNQNIAAIDAGGIFIPNTQYLLSRGISEEDAEGWFDSPDLSAVPGQMRFYNASPRFQLPLVTAVFARQGAEGDETIKVLFSPDELAESFGTGTNSSFIITLSGDVLIHPDIDLVLGGANFSYLPIVALLQQEGDSSRRQISFADPGGAEYFGAYYNLPETDVTVLTIIPHDIVFEAVRAITLQNTLLTGAVLFIAILFIWFFSKTISSPVRALADAALRIETGEFEINLKAGTRDELGLLTDSFNKMSGALNVFGRFTNKDIAVRAMRGDIKPGGLPKHATILFSDIRNFTEKSEAFTKAFGNEAPNRIVRWLNNYITRMVDCIEKTGGDVDKFIGDGIMAHWGTASTAGNPAADACNCVKSALMMRAALAEINAMQSEDNPGSKYIRIGCGINTGVVTAGQIGSEQRMEYTVIGDPVNLASRAEALNKSFGTDILIAEDTWELVKDKFITEEMPPAQVKGKEKSVRMFAVINSNDTSDTSPQTLAELRALMGTVPPPEFN